MIQTGIIKRDTGESYVTGTLKNGGGIVRSRVKQGGGGGISMETQFVGVCEDNNNNNNNSQFPGSQLLLPSAKWTSYLALRTFVFYRLHLDDPPLHHPRYQTRTIIISCQPYINPLNPELNPIFYLLALLRAHNFLHVSRIRVKLLTLRRLMSYIYIYIEHPFLMFLDHTQRRSTVGRTPLDE